MYGIKRLMNLHRLMDQANGAEGGTGGGGGGEGGSAAGEEEAAAAAAKVLADEAAALAAAGEKTGKPSDAEALLLKDLMKQKAAAKAAAAALSELQKKYEGIDPDKARTSLAQSEEDERKKAEDRGEYTRLVKQMGDRHAADLTAAQEGSKSAQAMNITLAQQIADLTVGSSFSGSKFVADDLTLTASKARVIYGSHFEFKDGAMVGYDLPAGASERTPLVDAAGRPLSFDLALSAIVEADPDRDRLIRSKSKPGAGSGTQTGAKKGVPSGNAPQLTGASRIAAGLAALSKP
jgi:hypothetical protein